MQCLLVALPGSCHVTGILKACCPLQLKQPVPNSSVAAQHPPLNPVACPLQPVDPRIHFALNCGAASCPPIRVYTPDKLEFGLEAAASAFCAGEGRLGWRLLPSGFCAGGEGRADARQLLQGLQGLPNRHQLRCCEAAAVVVEKGCSAAAVAPFWPLVERSGGVCYPESCHAAEV
jgi:hypothetical protein